ncbi:hypothetical protein [Kribbella sp. CA-293567]|uniref:hypothetical protein n=1 Tax=Kribbella sp. CA-293567 TaxID=3002436 RepID=UPI0022DCE9EA|nr:hypothetical protein [Kribbella sp. CA-293567]WBQ07546.1 hypothetical protein OX958_12245 [Kribbella sp. CA-293567]
MAYSWATESNLSLVGEQFFPKYRVALLSGLNEVSPSNDQIKSLNRTFLASWECLAFSRFRVGVVDKNPDGLLIALGSEEVNGLRETLLGAMTDNMAAMLLWKKLRGRARRSMRKGAWIVNTAVGTRVRDDAHLYTPGAKELQDRGLPILGSSDWIRFDLT